MQNNYDIIIIGGGISGLYSAYKILQIAPKTKLLVLERYNKKWMGGRMGNALFQGTVVVNGAGVGRKEKDKLLFHLLDDMNIPYKEGIVSHNHAQTISPICNVEQIFHMLKRKFKENPSNVTFKRFALPILGSNLYKQFIICSGYSDYENSDVGHTLYHYGFDDTYSNWTALYIPWKQLIETISKKIGLHCIQPSSEVMRIDNSSMNTFTVHIETGKTYSCNKVILATNITSIIDLLPRNLIYQQIHGQPFLRVYGKFNKASIQIMKQFIHGSTIVPGPLKKIIPMDPDKGVYMIAYTDNQGAEYLKDYLENTPTNRDFFCHLLEKSIGIPIGTLRLIAIKDFYWSVGTHYFEPLRGPFKDRKDFIKKAQNPMDGMLVVGEMISMKQGWTEGALESVESVITKKWIDDKW